ncbi:MAG TPA: type II secretion system protein [Chthoniobacterales bacterium]|jgi:prepilin-type N-terminal cleavage/methylation domain-containing protein
MKKKSAGAFTLIEMLVVISIIVVLAAFAGPALFSALAKGQMTASLNNAHQLYLAGQQMALDGATNSDATRAWPGELSETAGAPGSSPAPITTLQQYATKLVQGDYLKAGDIQKILSAPGATCTATADTSSGAVTLAGKSGLKVYKIKETDSTNTVFAVTSNYTYGTALDANAAPYGDKGFVVHRKGGDSSVLKKNNATVVSGQESNFQSVVGKKPGDADGSVTPGDSAVVLVNP